MKKNAIILFILRIFKTVLAIATLSVTAKYFGVSLARDEWLLSIGFIVVLDNAIWGPINETFRAQFIFLQHEIGNEASLQKARSMFTFINLTTVIIVSLIILYPGVLARIIAPGYNKQQVIHLSAMILLLIPSFLFNQICQFLTSVLNAYEIYFIPEISGFIASILNIILIITLSPYIGIHSLVAGYYTGIIILMIFLILNLNKKGIHLISNPLLFKLKDVKPYLKFALPFFLPALLSQSNNILEKSLASNLGIGVVSIIDYSKRFSENIVMVLAGIFTTMLLPVLCKNIANEKQKAFLYSFSTMFQFSIIIMTFLVGLLTACPASIINILYNKGNIDSISLNQITNLCRIYSWAEFMVLMFYLFGIALVSAGKGKTYALYGSLAQLGLIILNLTLIKKMGVLTLPISMFVSHLIISTVLFLKFPVRTFHLKIMAFKGLVQVIICSLSLYLINLELITPYIYNPYIIVIANTVIMALLILAFTISAKTDDLRLLLRTSETLKKYSIKMLRQI